MSGGKYGQLYGGNWLKAEDLKATYTPVVLTQIRPEAIRQNDGGERTMLVVGFARAEKRLILNATNYASLCGTLGKNEDAWEGQAVNLHKTVTQMAGKTVPCIRVVPAAQTAPPPAPLAAPGPLPVAPPLVAPLAAAAPSGPPVAPGEASYAQAPTPPIEAYADAGPFDPAAEDDEIPF